MAASSSPDDEIQRLVISCPLSLKEAFREACAVRDTDMNKAGRELMRRFILETQKKESA